MREKEWWEKNVPEKIFSVFAGILYGIWFAISRTIYSIYWLLRKFTTDVLKTVYGKFVALVAAIVFAWIIAQSLGVITH